MAEYDNTNKGVAFKNDYKTEDKHPYYKGKGNFKGQDFEFGIWIKENDKGKFLTFAFSEPYKKNNTPNSDDYANPKTRDSDIKLDDPINLDDIPF
jgi:hypothetical protein